MIKSFVRRYWLVLLLSLTGIMPAGATEPFQPGTQDVYTINEVLVDVAAGNAASARDQAIAAGQRQALQQLLERLGTDLSVSTLTDEAIVGLVQDFAIVRERASATRYLATLQVRFRPTAVRQMLQNANLSFTDRQSPPVLVLPVWQQAGRSVLWEETTPWYEAWQQTASQNGLIPFIVPPIDLKAASTINATDALQENQTALVRAVAAYQVSGVIVPVLQLSADGKIAERVQLLRFGSDGSAAAGTTINLTTAALPDQMSKGIATIRSQLEQAWQAAMKTTSGPANRLMISVPLQDAAAWPRIQQQLRQVSQVEQVQVLSLTRQQVLAELAFRGEVPTLQEQLSQQQLSLARNPQDGGWLLFENIRP